MNRDIKVYYNVAKTKKNMYSIFCFWTETTYDFPYAFKKSV